MDTKTYRLATHQPTGDRVIVVRIDFRDNIAQCQHVTAHDGRGHIRKVHTVAIPAGELIEFTTREMSDALARELYRNGVKAYARKHGMAVRFTRKGNAQLVRI